MTGVQTCALPILTLHKRVHMIGVKGVGMAALAEVLVKNGFMVSGSDAKEDFITAGALKRFNIPIAEFSAENVKNAGAVIRSNAYNSDNIEVRAAQDLNIPIFSYPEVVAELFNAHYGIAVAGSHGKTTTTAMLAHILKSAEKNITAIVGSTVLDWGSGAISGDLAKPDALFVLEADEYKEAFLNYRPRGAIITNIDYDHPDYYKTESDYENGFVKFIAQVPENGFLVINADDARLKELARNAKAKVIETRAGDFSLPDLRLAGKPHTKSDANPTYHQRLKAKPFRSRTDVYQKISTDFVWGEHNRSNAALAYRAALELGVSETEAKTALANFKGTARRMELVGESNGAAIYDDYAHHPSEIRATLKAMREKYPAKKIVAVFQPHTYSRTKALFGDFTGAFNDADEVILTDVFSSAREQKDESVNISDMAAAIEGNGKKITFIINKTDIPARLKEYLNPSNIIITMGAGDIYKFVN